MNFCLTLIGTLFVPMFALGENLVDCSAVLQTGVQKKTVNNITGWSAISKQEILVNNSNALFLSKEIAETNSLMLLASVLKNNTDKQIKTVIGAKVINSCVNKNFVYVQTWVDDISIQQAEAMKSSMANSLANNPTPRSANTQSQKESDSTSDLENLVKEMNKKHK